MKIHIRKRKLSGGKERLYLEFYKGYEVIDGKTVHNREFEYPDPPKYIYSKDRSKTKENKEALLFMDKLKSKRLLEYEEGKYGFFDKSKLKTDFLVFFRQLAEERKQSKGNYGNWDSVHKHLEKCFPNSISMEKLNRDAVLQFKNYLEEDARTKNDKPLSQNTKNSYFAKFKAAINEAIDDGLLLYNPTVKVKGIKSEKPHRDYLTIEELAKLKDIESDPPVIRRAFLFCCLTGLRFSDMIALKWGNLVQDGDETKLSIVQQKTKEQLDIFLDAQALKIIGERRGDEEKIFRGLKYSAWTNLKLKEWALQVVKGKTVTWHVARHTFATIMLEQGADLYTISKILGHSELKTTAIYTKITEKKKREIVKIIPNIGI